MIAFYRYTTVAFLTICFVIININNDYLTFKYQSHHSIGPSPASLAFRTIRSDIEGWDS